MQTQSLRLRVTNNSDAQSLETKTKKKAPAVVKEVTAEEIDADSDRPSIPSATRKGTSLESAENVKRREAKGQLLAT